MATVCFTDKILLLIVIFNKFIKFCIRCEYASFAKLNMLIKITCHKLIQTFICCDRFWYKC